MTRRIALMAVWAVVGQIIKEPKSIPTTGSDAGVFTLPRQSELIVPLGGESGYERFHFRHEGEEVVITAVELFAALKAK